MKKYTIRRRKRVIHMDKFKSDIEKDVIKFRCKYNVDSYGINDIFLLVDKMDIYQIRLPLGIKNICGFSTVYESKKIIVSNSSEILSKEILATAHSIAHCEYDLDVNIQSINIDYDTSNVSEEIGEIKANYFAKALLVPESKLSYYIKYELEKNVAEITIIDIIRIQIEFNVSYEMVVDRLYDLKLLSKVMRDQLEEEKETDKSRNLFRIMNLNEHLLSPAEIMKVPSRYYEFVFRNYENGYVSFEKYKEALEIVGFDVAILKDKEEEEDLFDLVSDKDLEEY